MTSVIYDDFRGNAPSDYRTKNKFYFNKPIKINVICKLNNDGSKKFIDVALDGMSLNKKLEGIKKRRISPGHYIVFYYDFESEEKVKDIISKIREGIDNKNLNKLNIVKDVIFK